jgi:DNA-binding winged helix-turn-helix (wHTH) protein/tetratricopeptide (TPR) repeat protein
MAHNYKAAVGIRLSREPAFELGAMMVHPATRQVVRNGSSETLEPRIMQVLVAFAQSEGEILGHDDLIERCWEGRIVGENAIHRAVSKVRDLGLNFAGGSFAIETITKVGYRMKVRWDEPAPRPKIVELDRASGELAPPPGPSLDRRWVLGAGAVAFAAAGAGAWRLGIGPWASRIKPEARTLFERGVEANRQGWIETGDQARTYFQQAVEIDPNFADAWGALALQMQLVASDDLGEVATAYRVRSAAKRALALDPRQREARVALGLLPGWFRRWAETERAILRLLDDYPQFPALTSHYGNLLAQVARFDEAVAMQERTISKWPFMPGPPNQLMGALCGAGRLVEAEARSEKSLRRWPRHPVAWSARMSLLTYSGRADAALAFAADPENHPRGIEQEISAIVATARALAHRRAADIEVAVTENLQSVRHNIRNAPEALHLFTALGDLDRSFDLIEAYLFRSGPLASGADPLTPFSAVYTDTLFHPYTRILWPDPRFAAITRKVGLDAYWKSIGFVPAFRR